MFKDFSVATLVTLITVAGGVAGAWYMIISLSAAVDDMGERLQRSLTEQAEIRKEMALQSADLESIRQVQGTIIGTVDQRFDSLEGSLNNLQLMQYVQGLIPELRDW